MATAATIKKNIAKLEAALKSKATPKSLKSKLEAQLVKSKAELSGINKGTKPKTSSTKSTQTALQKLKEMVNKNKKLKTYKKSGVDLEKDADRPAKPIGKRTAKSGNTYYEYRANRIDVKQPPKRYPKLEKGGYMANGGEIPSQIPSRIVRNAAKAASKDGYEYNIYYNKDDKEFSFSRSSMSDFYKNEILVGVVSSNGEVTKYAKGGKAKTSEEKQIEKAEKSLEYFKKEAAGGNEYAKKNIANLEEYIKELKENKYAKGGVSEKPIPAIMDKYGNVKSEKKLEQDLEDLKEAYEDKLVTKDEYEKSYNEIKEQIKFLQKKEKGGYMAKGGMLMHGFNKGDKVLDIYKGQGIVDNGGVIVVVNPDKGTRFIIDLDESKPTGRKSMNMSIDDQIKSAKEYIDWVSSDGETPDTLVSVIDKYGSYEKGGEVDRERMYNFLKEDLAELENAIEENNQEEIEKFFSYWNIHLKSLEPKTGSKRTYEFLKDDLVGLEAATKELPSSKEETDRFFSYWNTHLKSLQYAKGGYMAMGGELHRKEQ